MVGGVGESRPAVEVDNFESSFNLSHPPEHLFPVPLSLPPARATTRLYSSAVSLYFCIRTLSFRAAVSRAGNILLKSCHVREVEHRLGDKK